MIYGPNRSKLVQSGPHCEMAMEMELGIVTWNWNLELEHGIGTWNWNMELELGIGTGIGTWN